MKSEKYEPIKFETWQELAKFVIDGGEVYFNNKKICFDNGKSQFSHGFTEYLMNNLMVKKQPTFEELIAIKPRLCWVWNESYDDKVVALVNSCNDLYCDGMSFWNNAKMLTDDEIKQFLSDGE